MAIYLPRRRTAQPQFPAAFDLSVVKKPPIVNVSPYFSSITRGVADYPNARSYKFVEASSQYNDVAFTDNQLLTGYTFIAVVAPTGTDSTYSNVFNGGNAAGSRYFQLRHNATTWYLYHNTNGTDWSAATWPYTANTPTVIVGRWDGATVYAYENGAPKGTPFAKGAFNAVQNTIRIGGDSNSGSATIANTYWEGGIGLFSLFDYDVGNILALELSRNPWQIFKRQPKALYFDLPAGGGGPTLITASDSLTPSFTEALALLSASSLSDTLTPSVSESVGLAVLVSATDTLTPSVTETASVIAAVLASDTLTPSLVESQASFVSSALSEAFTLSLGEVQGSLLTSAVTDVATISVSESAAVLVAIAGSDTYVISITDSASVAVAEAIAKAATESLSLSLTEVASVVTVSLWAEKSVAITVWTDKADASTLWSDRSDASTTWTEQ